MGRVAFDNMRDGCQPCMCTYGSLLCVGGGALVALVMPILHWAGVRDIGETKNCSYDGQHENDTSSCDPNEDPSCDCSGSISADESALICFFLGGVLVGGLY